MSRSPFESPVSAKPRSAPTPSPAELERQLRSDVQAPSSEDRLKIPRPSRLEGAKPPSISEADLRRVFGDGTEDDLEEIPDFDFGVDPAHEAFRAAETQEIVLSPEDPFAMDLSGAFTAKAGTVNGARQVLEVPKINAQPPSLFADEELDLGDSLEREAKLRTQAQELPVPTFDIEIDEELPSEHERRVSRENAKRRFRKQETQPEIDLDAIEIEYEDGVVERLVPREPEEKTMVLAPAEFHKLIEETESRLTWKNGRIVAEGELEPIVPHRRALQPVLKPSAQDHSNDFYEELGPAVRAREIAAGADPLEPLPNLSDQDNALVRVHDDSEAIADDAREHPLDSQNPEAIREKARSLQIPDAIIEQLVTASLEPLEEIGRGAEGRVFRCMHQRLSDPAHPHYVALKVYAPHRKKSAQSQRSFTREARILANIDHPNIISALDGGGVPDPQDPENEEKYTLSWYTMPIIKGRTVEAAMKEGSLSIPESISAFRDAAEGLAALHARNIVHRDLKPANILVDGKGIAKIADLGLAEDLTDPALRKQAMKKVAGTPYYLAPEYMQRSVWETSGDPALVQAAEEMHVGIETDIYSMGASLYHVTTGQPPFERDKKSDPIGVVFRKILIGKKIPPNQINPDIPDSLNTLILDAMALDPKVRPTAAEFAERLRTIRSELQEDTEIPEPEPEPVLRGMLKEPAPRNRSGNRVARVGDRIRKILGV